VIGLFVHNLFTGWLRTRDPLLLAAMAILGFAGLASDALPLAESLSAGYARADMLGILVCFASLGVFGSALLVCVTRNVVVKHQK
jgi:hypothetical protein